VIRTNRALTILCSYPFRHVQIILRLYKSPGEVLLGFDIDSCCVGYDGDDLWCMERFRRAITKRYNLVNVSRRSTTYEQRLFKYSKRGFAVAVPNLDKSRVNPVIFNHTIRNLQGLSKLILYDYNQNNNRSNFSRPSRKAGAQDVEEGSDYNNDLPIPWGPEWQTEAIINLLNIQNKAKFFSSLRRNQKQTEQGEKPVKAYNHLFTSNAEKLQTGNFSVWKRSLDGIDVQRPIEWIKDNPAYQDFDNGFRRLMTGSFEPACADNWEEGVYLQPGQPQTLGQPALSSNASSIKDSKGSPPRHQGLGLVSSPKPVFGSSLSVAPVSLPQKQKLQDIQTIGGVYTGSTDPSSYGGGGFGVMSGAFSTATDISQFGTGGIFTGATDVSAFGGGGTFGVPTATQAFSFTGPTQGTVLSSLSPVKTLKKTEKKR